MKQVTYNKILVTHDGSKLASAALEHAASLALTFKSKVIIVQVIDSITQSYD